MLCFNPKVEQHSELMEAYKTLDYAPKIPDYTMLLKVGASDSDGEMSALLKLPDSDEALDKVLDQIGAGSQPRVYRLQSPDAEKSD